MPKLVPYQPIDHSFWQTANLVVSTEVTIRCQPSDIMETMRGDTVWTEWAGALTGVEWTCDKPYGLGSTRTVNLVGGMAVKEVFFHWEEGKRVSFYVEEGSIPDVASFAEDYVIDVIDSETTRLTWAVALEMQGVARFFIPVSRFFMGLAFKRWLRNYKALLESGT